MTARDSTDDRLRQLADSVDCLTEDDLLLLAGITRGTAEAWRKRGSGPAYLVVGNRVLYPRTAVAEFLQSLVRERRRVEPRGLL